MAFLLAMVAGLAANAVAAGVGWEVTSGAETGAIAGGVFGAIVLTGYAPRWQTRDRRSPPRALRRGVVAGAWLVPVLIAIL